VAIFPFSKEAIRDLKDTKGYVYLAAAIFGAAAVGGAILSESLLAILGPFKELAESISGKSPVVMVLMIFAQNSFSTLLSVWLGFLFCLVPLYTLILNGTRRTSSSISCSFFPTASSSFPPSSSQRDSASGEVCGS
jgi:hypothetical protein